MEGGKGTRRESNPTTPCAALILLFSFLWFLDGDGADSKDRQKVKLIIELQPNPHVLMMRNDDFSITTRPLI